MEMGGEIIKNLQSGAPCYLVLKNKNIKISQPRRIGKWVGPQS